MIEIGKMLLDGSEIIFKPPCPCEECSEQYIPPKKQQVGLPHWFYTGTLDDVWADLLARKFCLEIFEHLHLVRNTVLSHGRLVQRRWLKKSNTKRKSFLKQLRPEMIENEKAVLDMNNEFLMDPTLSQNHRKTFMLPYLNIETLSKDGSRMLRLVHYRVSHHPADWAPFDNQQLLSGWFLGAFTEEFNSGCMTISREEYGVWKPFDGAKGNKCHSRLGDGSTDLFGSPRRQFLRRSKSSTNPRSTSRFGNISSRFCHVSMCKRSKPEHVGFIWGDCQHGDASPGRAPKSGRSFLDAIRGILLQCMSRSV